MQLKLKHSEKTVQTLGGAFIRGNTPAGWLRTIDSWNIPPGELTCFIIAQNNQPHEAAGLFVVFQRAQLPNLLQIQHPYAVIAGKLFIPLDAELVPQVSEEELQQLLIWDYQVFHPAHGFTGFEKSDRIFPRDLLHIAEPMSESWHYAHPGQAPCARLQQISIQPIDAADIFQSVKDEVNSKSLEDIPKPKDGKGSALSKLLNPLGQAALKGGLFVANGLINALSAGGTQSNAGSGDEPGLLNRLADWMANKLQDLEKQRDTELKRLSDLFEKNTDEALKYAIPLSSKYFNRGTGQASGRLTRRSLHFNLGKLGGGQAVDGWNLDNYYNELRAKYLKAANKAIAEKDYKKAAYVYAHLLADYQAAAGALRQGKHYREAAVLYKEHLKNIPEAALCLEEGGLLLEAIDLYASIDRHEKAGDLYTILEQRDAARQCYEQCAERAADNKDYLEVSRIVADKIGDNERAKKTLITGWNDVKQPDACLLKYFDIVANEKQHPLHQEVQQFYGKQPLSNKKMNFLLVLDKVNKQHPSPELEDTCRNIAYEMVSEQVEKGNANSLHMLKHFVPADQLLSTDCHRFIHTKKEPLPPASAPAVKEVRLVNDMRWTMVLNWRNELLVLGVKSKGIYLARMNWEGHLEYYSWNLLMNAEESYCWVADDTHSNIVILHSSLAMLPNKILPENNYFRHELVIKSQTSLPNNLIGVHMMDSTVLTLHSDNNETFLNNYSLTGELKGSASFRYDLSQRAHLPYQGVTTEMFYSNDYFYLPYVKTILRVHKYGAGEWLVWDRQDIQLHTAAFHADAYMQIAIATNKGCVMAWPDANEWNIQYDFFATGVTVYGLYFISAHDLAVASAGKVTIYEVTKGQRPQQLQIISVQDTVISVFPAGNHNQVGILEEGGKITIHGLLT